ncbi:terminase gpA endonuclease subunit [Thalassoglobus sp.]|uniref:terminase gpA endonuclease subunit n=1 Tax=Thalassoglobus sp. TaxID=2795869 RepID=UPI003AA7FA45
MISSCAHEELNWFLQRSRAAKVRSMLEFAESEIVIPDGPYEGRRFRCQRQPYTGLWFDAIDSGSWNRFVATGPTQSGKTLACFLVPLLYHLFEVGETVICGLPDMDMAADKWREDILPIIEKSRYRNLMPSKGGGSRGGKVEAIQFLNGATLKFMSGGGGDKSRAGFTSRVVVITETDGMDTPGASSRESDKVTQLEARTRAYGSRKRIYLECTVSTQQGRTWQEYQNGTSSKIALRCPHCQVWVVPEREQLKGWRETDSQVAARSCGQFHCPECEKPWDEAQRTDANRHARLLHHGQTIENEELVGEPKPTETLGFRWSAVHNLFLEAGEIAADEWRASRSADEDNAEREMRQFVWCLPVLPSRWEETAIRTEEITHRVAKWQQGIVPAGTQHLTAAIDLGKYLCHWVLVAWSPQATGHIADYGRIEVASPELGVEKALLVALQEFGDRVLEGWQLEGSEETVLPGTVWVDAGYMTDVVYRFSQDYPGFLPAVGRGATQQRQQWYQRPKSTGAIVRQIGEGYHLSKLQSPSTFLFEVNADHWKTWVHQRLATPLGEPGAMTLFQAPAHEHLSLAKHLTAEKKTEEFLPGKGVVTRWECIRRNNHWFDALYNACAAGHYVGARLIQDSQPEPRTYGKLSDLAQSKRDQRGGMVDTQRWERMMERYTRIEPRR